MSSAQSLAKSRSRSPSRSPRSPSRSPRSPSRSPRSLDESDSDLSEESNHEQSNQPQSDQEQVDALPLGELAIASSPSSVSASQSFLPDPADASNVLAQQTDASVPRPTDQPIEATVELPNQPPLVVQANKRTRRDALKEDDKYLFQFALRLFMRQALLDGANELANIAALSDLNLTRREREEQLNSLRLQCRTPFETLARALCECITYRDPRPEFQGLATFAPNTIIDNLARIYMASGAPIKIPFRHQLSLERAIQISHDLPHAFSPWPLLVDLHCALFPQNTHVFAQALYEEIRKDTPNKRPVFSFHTDRKTPKGLSTQQYVNSVAQLLEYCLEEEAYHPAHASRDQENYFPTASVQCVNVLLAVMCDDTLAVPVRFCDMIAIEDCTMPKSEMAQKIISTMHAQRLPGGIPVARLRQQGLWLSLCGLLMPQVASAYQTCLASLVLAKLEEQTVSRMHDQYQQRAKDALKGRDDENIKNIDRAHQARSDVAQEFALAFCEAIESILIVTLAIFVPHVRAYVHPHISNKDLPKDLVARSLKTITHYDGAMVGAALWMNARVNRLMHDSMDTKALPRTHVVGTVTLERYEQHPRYQTLQRRVNAARSPVSVASETTLQPVRPRGVQNQDIPAQTVRCLFNMQIPQTFINFFFKVQDAWRPDHPLEKDLVLAWNRQFPDFPNDRVFRPDDAQAQPYKPEALICARMPKMNREFFASLDPAPVRYEGGIVREQLDWLVKQQKKYNKREEREYEQAKKKAKDYINIYLPSGMRRKTERMMARSRHLEMEMFGTMRRTDALPQTWQERAVRAYYNF